MYGDYYVCGYELGAEAGATLSAATKSSSSEETLTLTIKVKLLFFEATAPPITTTKKSSDASTSMSFCGYSTLQHEASSLTCSNLSMAEQQQFQRASSAYLQMIASLDQDVRKVKERLKLKDGHTLPLSDCTAICQSGLVVRLLLAPFARLNAFVSHAGQK